tara:strand:- start:789 stop:1448 length:660 start_codon:yes stop_codon:yes gene_type:complete
MPKKQLLNETQVRQFMKLASLEPLTPGFVEGLTKNTKDIEESHGRGRDEGAAGYGHPDANSRLEEDEESELHATEDELGHEDEFADEEAADLDALEPEPAPEMAADPARMISVDDFLGALETALEGVLDDEVEIDSDEMEEPVEDEVEMDVELDAADMEADTDMEMDDGPLEEGGDKKGDQSEELDYEKNESAKATDELVEAITKRVAARILKTALAKK